jgi:hypothetical protein
MTKRFKAVIECSGCRSEPTYISALLEELFDLCSIYVAAQRTDNALAARREDGLMIVQRVSWQSALNRAVPLSAEVYYKSTAMFWATKRITSSRGPSYGMACRYYKIRCRRSSHNHYRRPAEKPIELCHVLRN